jgi:aldehyde:ferredoxin oxidoreductase
MLGFHGKLLRINLNDKAVKEETISDDVFTDYLGGKGLGSHLLFKFLPPKADPLSEDNKIIFVTGPATDTIVPAAGRHGVFAKSPQTGFFGESYSGGHTAPAIKRTGYDAIMLEGSSDNPVYLHVSNKGVNIEDASDLWGKETYETEDALLAKVAVKGAQAVVIGPAGENLVKFACIKNNHWRSAGRTGMGAVMGSKKVKGIVFSGSVRAPMADEELLKNYVRQMIKDSINTERTKNMKLRGTPYMATVTNQACAFPTRYWSAGKFENWQDISSDAMLERMDVTPRACSRCFMACSNLSKVTSGRHKGLVLEGPEYETLYAIGGLCCVSPIEEVVYLNDICDRLGLDTISGGNMAAFSIEAGKMGKLSGMPDYGDVDGIAKLFQQIAAQEGIGKLLSQGIKHASKELDLEDLAVHVKGLEPAGYDPRILPGMSLGYAVSDRGACHLRSGFYMGELRGLVDKDMVEGKAKIFIEYENRNCLEDCLIICRMYQQFIDWEGMQVIIKATMGIDLSLNGLKELASRVTTVARKFNIREGLSKADDNIPSRLFKDAIGPDKNHVVNPEHLAIMIQEYYDLHGWDENGIPLEE